MAKRKKAGCSCKTTGLLMRRPFSVYTRPVGAAENTPAPPRSKQGASWEQVLLQSFDSSHLSCAMCILCTFICLVISSFAEKYGYAQVERIGSLVLVNRQAPKNPALMNL